MCTKTERTISDLVIFIAVSVCLQSSLGYALKIVIDPKEVNGLVHGNVSVSCRMEQSDSNVKTIMVMEVTKGGKALVIFRHDSKVSIAAGMEHKVQAVGKIFTPLSDSYLCATLLNPTMEDSGEYSCLLYYMDPNGVLNDKTVNANLSVTSHEVKSSLRFLADEMSVLKAELTEEKDKRRAKEAELESRVVSLTNQVNSQQKLLKQQEQILHELQRKDNSIEMFTAVHTTGQVLVSGNDLIYDHLVTNGSRGYNETTGVFTAPVAGYYTFHLSVLITEGLYAFIDLMSSSGQTLTTIRAGDYRGWMDQSSGSCFARLTAGEEIRPVVLFAYGTQATLKHYRTGDYTNIFSGFLLKAL